MFEYLRNVRIYFADRCADLSKTIGVRIYRANRCAPTGAQRDRFTRRTSLLAIVVAAAAVVACGDVRAAESTWKAGVAQKTITPKKLMWMSGYGSRTAPAEGKADDLMAKALVLEDADKTRVVLITLDLVGIDRATSQDICKRLYEKYGFERAQIAINCSHTHCGPVVGTNLKAMYDIGESQWKLVDDYTEALKQNVVTAVGDALKSLAPADVYWGSGTATFAVNRRENKEAEVPKLREEGKTLKGPNDHDVPVLAVYDPKGPLRAVAFGYACHATTLSFQNWSADYPGRACNELQRRSLGAIALFWAGCGADQNPIPRRTYELAEHYGKRLGEAVHSVLRDRDSKQMKPLAGRLTAEYTEIPLRFARTPTKAELETEAAKGNKYEQGRAKSLLAKLSAGEAVPTEYPYPVQTWRLGDGPRFVTLGGEVVVDYALRLKQELGAKTTWVAGYSNDVMCYIPSRRVLGEGGYEGASSMTIYGMPSAWHAMLEEAIVKAVHEQGKR